MRTSRSSECGGAERHQHVYAAANGSFSGGQNYSGASIGNQSNNQYIGRLDHKFNDKNSIFIHYIYGKRDFSGHGYEPELPLITGTYPMPQCGAAVSAHLSRPTLVNEVRTGVNMEHVKAVKREDGNGLHDRVAGINGFLVGGPNGRPLTSNEEGFPLLTISGFLGMGDSRAASNLELQQDVHVRGQRDADEGQAHAVVRRGHSQGWRAMRRRTTRVSASRASRVTRRGMLRRTFILGVSAYFDHAGGRAITAARQWRTAEYFQDNFRLNDKLTLNLGIRYEIYAPPVDNEQCFAHAGLQPDAPGADPLLLGCG